MTLNDASEPPIKAIGRRHFEMTKIAAAPGESLPADVAELHAEIAKLRKINRVLMDRVENDMNAQGGNAFTLFQAAITLENKVAERTAELTELTRQLMHQISVRRAAENALQAAKAEAERANLSKTRFLAAASHDLNQPLNVARLFLGMLAEEVATPHTHELVDGVEAALDTVNDLLRALLDISRLDAGVWPVEMTDFDVGPVFDKLRREYGPQAEAAGLELVVVPSSATVRSDRVLLERVLRNLVSNALRYTERGRILIGCRRQNGHLRFEVWDTGIGIPGHSLSRIFEEFQQLGEGPTGQEKGLGLGLAIVQRIAYLLDTTIEVASTPGHGSMFSLLQPLGKAASGIAGETADIVPIALAGRCVVVIDDDEHVLEAMRALLQSWNCATIAVRSSEAAARLIRQAGQAPEIIIADYHLDDGVFGTQAIASLRGEFGQNLPALIISSDHSPELKQSLKEQGLGFLLKPTPPMKLRAMLSYLLTRG
ncbi:MAG TPA: hybrid sensor histidine kinase/response regulator [Beijerinckia sp.]|jgi:signal transduction histidine kinase/CheY-like chemotaxis protein|nr:hybrid sensor histidine kinase/response regulator [Beijerinckia sp.]